MNFGALKTSIMDYGKEITSSSAKWLDFTKQVGQLTGNHKLLDYTTSFRNMDNFIMRTPKWTIGGAIFSGIMRTSHIKEVTPTTYPVQNGAIMTDHAILMPTELDIQIMVSDAEHENTWQDVRTGSKSLDFGLKMYDKYRKIKSFEGIGSSFLGSLSQSFSPPGQVAYSGERGKSAWGVLSAMRDARVPIEVVTRLQTYKNMLITSINTDDDVTTLHGLSVTVHLREIHVANVADVATSARQHTTDSTAGGAVPVEASEQSNKTLLKQGVDGFMSIGKG